MPKNIFHLQKKYWKVVYYVNFDIYLDIIHITIVPWYFPVLFCKCNVFKHANIIVAYINILFIHSVP